MLRRLGGEFLVQFGAEWVRIFRKCSRRFHGLNYNYNAILSTQ
jgi:hypothetical protein